MAGRQVFLKIPRGFELRKNSLNAILVFNNSEVKRSQSPITNIFLTFAGNRYHLVIDNYKQQTAPGEGGGLFFYE